MPLKIKHFGGAVPEDAEPGVSPEEIASSSHSHRIRALHFAEAEADNDTPLTFIDIQAAFNGDFERPPPPNLWYRLGALAFALVTLVLPFNPQIVASLGCLAFVILNVIGNLILRLSFLSLLSNLLSCMASTLEARMVR